jgi:hypothetical protein
MVVETFVKLPVKIPVSTAVELLLWYGGKEYEGHCPWRLGCALGRQAAVEFLRELFKDRRCIPAQEVWRQAERAQIEGRDLVAGRDELGIYPDWPAEADKSKYEFWHWPEEEGDEEE